ncbi:hypothetical protein O3M35_003548 [Rhynocoris fuscipes]|uniref:HIT-type domain-containing protein n=1 Tax=Rhynocoris fuscipes TaxID=488301 RepID=A0AAW1CR60_9HEMI
MDNQDNLCKICNIEPSKYVCPRCNAPYCSVNCYKAPIHSNCSEAFYKECIQEYVKSQENDLDSKKKMIEVLQRVKEFDENNTGYSSDDSDDIESINNRLEGVNLDDADLVWDKLTDEERQEFLNLIKEGDVSELLPIWEPWWDKTYKKPKVRFADETDDESYLIKCPKVPKNIPILSKITNIKPSEYIFNNLVNVLGSYSIMCRYCNGEHNTMPKEATTILLSISKNLSENENFISFNFALESVIHEALNSEFITTSESLSNTMREDVVKILKGPNEENCIYFIEAVLTDIDSILRNYKKQTTKTSKGKFSSMFPEENINTNKFSKDLVTKCVHKIKYYQSWCLEYYTSHKYL